MRGAAAITAIALLTACGEKPASPGGHPAPPEGARTVERFVFTNVAPECGIDFTPTSGADPSTKILEVKGGGIALVDTDGDGDLDVFVPNGATLEAPYAGPGCRLFENLGDLTFRDATGAAGLDGATRWTIGVAAGDIEGDGDVDLYLTCYGPNQLWRNDGDGTFTEIAEAAGVAGDQWSAAASFGDLDGDGDLDLYVANYLVFDAADPPPDSTFRGMPVIAGPRGLPAAPDAVYENLGDATFADRTASSGCGDVAPAFGLGTVILDFDGDGRQDVFVGNDSMANFLFVNQGDWRFAERGLRTGIASNAGGSNQATMGIALGDVDGNGWPDLFTTNFASDTNTLHLNKGGAFFDDGTRRFGLGMVSFQSLGWGTGLYDLDHDGHEDLTVFNGHVYPNATLQSMGSPYRQAPLLFAGTGGRFERIEADLDWLTGAWCDRGCAFGDLDDDGDVDIVVNELNGPVRVLRNDGAAGQSIQVEVVGSPLGCVVDVTRGERAWRRWIRGGGSFVSVDTTVAHVGLGDDFHHVDVTVTWPDGHVETRAGVAVNQRLRVERVP